MGKKAYLTEEPPHEGLALVDALSLEAFLSHDQANGMQLDFSRIQPLDKAEQNYKTIRIGQKEFHQTYKDPPSEETPQLSSEDTPQLYSDLEGLLTSVDPDIIKAISRNQLQGRGIDLGIAYTFLDGGKKMFNCDFHNRVIFQDIVSDDNKSVTITDVSLQSVSAGMSPPNTDDKTMADVSFLEERSYTYAWLPVAEQITKYKKELPPLSISASDKDMGHIATTSSRDVTNKVTQAYTKYLSDLQEYTESGRQDIYLPKLQHYIEDNQGRVDFETELAQFLFSGDLEDGKEYSIDNPDDSTKPYIFIYTDGKWIPQFFIDHDNKLKPASFRLHDGELQTVATTNHTSTVQMVCDEKDMKTMLNGQLNLSGENDLPPLTTDNVSSFHLHIEFIRLSLEKIEKGQHTPEYKQKIAKQLFDKYFTAIENGTYYQTTETSQKFLGLSKQLTKGDREDLTPLKNAFLTSIGGDPEYTQKINALFTKLENSQKSRLQRTIMATSRVLLNFLKLIFFPIVVIIKLATYLVGRDSDSQSLRVSRHGGERGPPVSASSLPTGDESKSPRSAGLNQSIGANDMHQAPDSDKSAETPGPGFQS